jgi:4-hydroxybenzoyl-CoA thioesterase
MLNMILNRSKLTSRQTIRIAWGDCDAAEIVYFPRYFAWFDAGTHALFDKVGLSFARLSELYGRVAIPLVATRATFILPSTYGDEVAIETAISRWGRSSFDVHHRLLRGDELAVECFETRVWTVRNAENRLEGQAVPQDVIALFATGEDRSTP